MSKTKKITLFQNLPNLVLFVGGVISILWTLYFVRMTLSNPYPLDLREGAAQVMTGFLLRGENPFALETQPAAFNNYGPIYSLTVLPLASVWGNTLRVHRLVTFVFIFFAACTAALVVYKKTRTLSFMPVCGAFMLTALMARAGAGAYPAALGTCLFLAAVFIPSIRNFDRASLVVSALLALAAFHTKAYFLLSFVIPAAYLFLFISKKQAVHYAGLFLAVFTVSAILIRLAFPLYFINTIFGNASNTFTNAGHLWGQLRQLAVYFLPMLLLGLIQLVRDLSSPKNGFPAFNFSDFNAPLLNRTLDYAFFSFILSLLAFLFVLGPHVGSYLSYAYQLVLPPFLIWFFSHVELKKLYGIFAALFIVLNLMRWQFVVLNPQMLAQAESMEWRKLYSTVEGSRKILATSMLTSRLVELGIPPLDSGQAIYYYSVQPYPRNDLLGPAFEEFYKAGAVYKQQIESAIHKREYDLIITAKEVEVFYDVDLIPEYYTLEKQIVVYMPQSDQKWVAQIWRPQ